MCGNFKKRKPLGDGVRVIYTDTSRELYLDQEITSYLENPEKNSKYSNLKSLHKAQTTYYSCLNKNTRDKFGDVAIPLELNSLGLPIASPFNLRLNEPLDFSKLLAKIHRSPFTKFLFDVNVMVDENDPSKTRLMFNYTPSIKHLSVKRNKFKDPEMVQLHSRLSEPELKKKKETNRNLLVQAITGAIKFMNELTNAPSSKKTNELVEKRIDEVVDFLTKLEETKALENTVDERNPDTYKYLTLDELQKETDKILEHSQIKVNEMMSNIRAAYWDTILESKWLDGKTKMAALSKLRSITQNVSFKDVLTDPQKIEELYEEVKT
ncbi:hypothetical protein V9T40_002604 [Parthenolecanium corni]|uniref:Peptidase M13 N-terminal domain-containing protein n=1 Tax=Parthenolecanium corni TaxID=536013 RepID=A0AAN9TXB2_9HEMI